MRERKKTSFFTQYPTSSLTRPIIWAQGLPFPIACDNKNDDDEDDADDVLSRPESSALGRGLKLSRALPPTRLLNRDVLLLLTETVLTTDAFEGTRGIPAVVEDDDTTRCPCPGPCLGLDTGLGKLDNPAFAFFPDLSPYDDDDDDTGGLIGVF